MTINYRAPLRLMRGLLTAAVFGITSLTGTAHADALVVAVKAAVTGSDPHQLFTPNRNVQLHVYETLVAQDAKVRPVPSLAKSWKAIDDLTWEFELRDDVKFSNGAPLIPEDVIFSIERAKTIEGTRTFRAYVRDVAKVEKAGGHTVRIITATPAPELPANLATIAIISKDAAAKAAGEDFNGGPAAVGTGPYRWVKFTPGQDVVLERNKNYRGQPGEWDKITFRFIPDDSTRIAALLSGSVDVVDAVPAGLTKRIETSPNLHLQSATSLFMHYMSIDRRETTPFATDAGGKKLSTNPFNDKRVREAVTHAINRKALAERVMEGAAEPAGQFMPAGFDGTDPDLQPPAYDPDLSRKLLAEAGYPDGFRYTIHCQNDRFTGDVRTCQTIAQMLTAVGIRTAVEAMPASILLTRATGETPEFSSYLAIFGSAAGLASNALNVLVQEWDLAKGTGRNNSGRYMNPELNALIDEAAQTIDDDKRQKLLRSATRIAVEDQAFIPLFFLKGTWGLRKGLTMEPRGDLYTMATKITAKAQQ